MPRGPRVEVAGGRHHIWQRGNSRRTIFQDAADRRLFLRLFERAIEKRGWIPLSYCLMGNHYHLVLETPVCNLGDGMRDLESLYAQLFHERHATGGGHLYQGRYGARLVTTSEQFAQLLRYVAFNPVEAALCSAPERWPWSSHAALRAGRSTPFAAPERVAALLEPFGGEPHRRYARLFEADGPLRHIPPGLSPWELRPPLAEIFRGADLAAAFHDARAHGYRVPEIADHLGVSRTTLWRRVKRTGPVPVCFS